MNCVRCGSPIYDPGYACKNQTCSLFNGYALSIKANPTTPNADPHGIFVDTIYAKAAPAETPPAEKVDHPAHYNPGPYEVINIIESYELDFCLGNAVKYILRAGRKPGEPELDDLNKALWYLKRRIESLKQKEEIPSNE